MKVLFRIFSFITVSLFFLGGFTMDSSMGATRSPKKQIIVATEREVYSLGGSIPIIVRYLNRTTSILSFREPAKTWEVKLMVGRRKKEAREVPFGRIFLYKSGDLERRTIEDAETIALKPSDVYEFHYDVGNRWPELFVPGVNVVRIKDLSDDTETISSNELEVRVVYDRSTFPMLLTIASDDRSTVESRRFASYWIGRIFPGFAITTEEPTDTQLKENRRRIAEARAWWDAHSGDPDTLKRIENVNR